MSREETLEKVKALLDALREAADTGAIIPVRLPGQIEEITQLVDKAQHGDDDDEAAGSGDVSAEQAEFVSIAIHELRTPMTSIRGYSDMLNSPSMGELSEMQQQFLDTIRVNAKRMEGLLTDVSDVNKIRAGTLKLTRKMDMYKNIAMMAEKNARPLAEELGRALTFDTPSGLPILETDGEMLAKAMTKLVENGLRYNDSDAGEVQVRGEADGSDLLIRVADDGIGMTPEEVAQLGTIYYRSDSDVVRNYKGSGLGIPVAFGIVEKLGGTIDVNSIPGEGTTFTIRLPGMT
jgi:signal transduction histidine kinase